MTADLHPGWGHARASTLANLSMNAIPDQCNVFLSVWGNKWGLVHGERGVGNAEAGLGWAKMQDEKKGEVRLGGKEAGGREGGGGHA